MLNKIEKIEVSTESHLFATAAGKMGFNENGYIEEEFFMYGTANIYEEDNQHNAVIRDKDIPYCNRFIVRKPQDRGFMYVQG